MDDTLYNRDKAFERFVERFLSRYASALKDEDPDRLRDALYQLDDHGYKSRREMFKEIIDRFSWRCLPGLDELVNYLSWNCLNVSSGPWSYSKRWIGVSTIISRWEL